MTKVKKPYGWRSKKYRCIHGPGNFEMPAANTKAADKLETLTPFYLEPQYPGQQPFGGVVPDVGILLFYRDEIGKLGIEPAYDGVEL
jgi:hypothetical protein